MPTLTIEGRKVKVDDNFLSMSPDEQNAAVEEIAGSIGITAQQPEKAQQAVEADPVVQQPVADPEPTGMQKFAGGVGAVVDGVAQGLTFGTSDEIAAGLSTGFGMAGDYDKALTDERARMEANAEYFPKLRLGSEIAGGVAGAGGLAKSGLTLLKSAKPTAKSLIGRGAAEGAAYGGAYGFGTGEGGVKNRAENAAVGAAFGGVIGGAAGGITSKIAGKRASQAIPKADDLKEMAQKAYSKAEAAGLQIQQPSFQKAVAGITSAARKAGFDPQLHPAAAAAFKRLLKDSSKPQSLEEMEILRRILKDAASSQTPGERRIASIAIEKMDDFLTNLSSSDIRAGKLSEAVPALKEARSLWARSAKGETVEQLIDRATTRAGGYGQSGFENALRTEFRQIAMNQKKLRLWSKEEQAAIKQIARGTNAENMMRWVGKFAPNGVVSTGISTGIGAVVGGAPGAIAVPTIAAGAKRGAEKAMIGNVNKFDDLVRSGGQMPAPKLTARDEALMRLATGQGGERVNSAVKPR